MATGGMVTGQEAESAHLYRTQEIKRAGQKQESLHNLKACPPVTHFLQQGS